MHKQILNSIVSSSKCDFESHEGHLTSFDAEIRPQVRIVTAYRPLKCMLIRSQNLSFPGHGHVYRLKYEWDSRREETQNFQVQTLTPIQRISVRLSAGALEGVGGDTTRSTLHLCHTHHFDHSTCTARCIHVLGRPHTHASTPFHQTPGGILLHVRTSISTLLPCARDIF